MAWRKTVAAFELTGKMRQGPVAQSQRRSLDAVAGLQQFERPLQSSMAEPVVGRLAEVFQKEPFQLPGGDVTAP